jgi:acyl-CoA thioesterase II
VRDLGADSAVSGGDGRYTATLAEGWDIWGPQGGYVGTVALRAAGAESSFPLPASFACHYLRAAAAGPVEIAVQSLRAARRAESLRVTLMQNGERILEALVWTVAELIGTDHDAATAPDVPGPEDAQPWSTRPGSSEPRFSFWQNLDVRPVVPEPYEWGTATEPRSVAWQRLHVRPPLEDPFVDAGRMLIAVDAAMYPAAMFAYDVPFPYAAPSMDLVTSFHRAAPDSEWILVEGTSPLSERALVAGSASVWSADGRLLASAMQQMLQRS